MKSKQLLIFILFFIFINSDNSINLTLIKEQFNEQIKKFKLPNSALILVKYDPMTNTSEKIIENYGKINNNNIAYGIGSISKSFTAMAISILINEGKILINGTIDKYINTNKFFPNEQIERANKTTIFSLLTHTSGLIEHTSENKLKFKYDEGKFNYANNGYGLLGRIIESVSGLTYREFIKEKIFNKLGMDNSEVGINEAINNPKVSLIDSYMNLFGFYKKVNNKDLIEDKFMTPAGFLVISEKDMSEYLESFIKKDKIGNESIIDTMIKNYKTQVYEDLNYGFGLINKDYLVNNKNYKIYSHEGYIETFRGKFAFIPELNIAGAFLTNTDDMIFNEQEKILNNFEKMLAGEKIILKSHFIWLAILFDLLAFVPILIGIFIIFNKIREIRKKSQEVTGLLILVHLIFNIIFHAIIPTILVILFIYFLCNNPSFNFMMKTQGTLVVTILIFVPIAFIGGLIKLIHWIHTKDNGDDINIEEIEEINFDLIDFSRYQSRYY